MKANPIKKVLIALDFNPTAQKVAEVGYTLARAMKAHVDLVHVTVDNAYYFSPEHFPLIGYSGSMIGTLQVDNANQSKIESEKYLEKIKVHLGDKMVETHVVEGDFADSILKAADDLNTDLIVIGSHSKRWLEEVLMGSVTEKILRDSKIPLFIIPTHKF